MDENNVSLITDEARALIGAETGYGEPYHIEKAVVDRFLEAIGDNNPLFFDGEYAADSWYGGLAVPPNFLLTNLKSGTERDFFTVNAQGELSFPVNARRRLRGADEIEILLPLNIGDTIRANTRITDIYEKEGRSGRMVFILSETSYKNQNEQIVMISRSTIIMR